MEFSRRDFLKVSGAAGAAVAVAGLTGCGSSEDKKDSASGGADKEAKYTVRLAYQPTSGQVFQFIAEKHGFNKEEGVTVESVPLGSVPDAVSALSAGKIDVASTYGTGGPLGQIANGQPFTIFGGYMIIGETPVYGKPESTLNSPEDLKGKKLGITRGGTCDISMKGILYDKGIGFVYDGSTYVGCKEGDTDIVTFIDYKKGTEVLEAIAKGEVDFGGTPTGHQLLAKDRGLEVKLWPDEYWPNHSCCRMFAKDDYVANNPDAVKALLRSYLRAEEYMQDHKDEVVDLVVENIDVTKETAETFVKSPHMKYDTDPFTNSVSKMWDKMVAFKYLEKGDVDLNKHLNDKIYEEALNSLIKDYPNSDFFKGKLTQFKENNTVLGDI